MRRRTIKCNVKKTISYRQIRNLYKTVEIIPYVPFRRFTDILNICENVNIELCARFLSYNNYFCRTISMCNARSTITMFHT